MQTGTQEEGSRTVTCSCNDSDGVYAIDDRIVPYDEYVAYACSHDDWQEHCCSIFPQDELCPACQGSAEGIMLPRLC